MESVKEYIDFMFTKLNELAIEDISYSDYDQMTDWMGEISNQVKRLEKKQEPMKSDEHGWDSPCPNCGSIQEYPNKYCPDCGQRIMWKED